MVQTHRTLEIAGIAVSLVLAAILLWASLSGTHHPIDSGFDGTNLFALEALFAGCLAVILALAAFGHIGISLLGLLIFMAAFPLRFSFVHGALAGTFFSSGLFLVLFAAMPLGIAWIVSAGLGRLKSLRLLRLSLVLLMAALCANWFFGFVDAVN